jgi:nucleoside-triphosphatase THEP1
MTRRSFATRLKEFWESVAGSAKQKAIRRAQSALEQIHGELASVATARWTAAALSPALLDDINAIVARTVSIAGEEGAGKSTLINGILGENVVPTDANQPGTVAPIFITAGVGTPRHVVACVDDSEQILCKTREAFESYLLQRHNRDNRKGVVRGKIETANPRLAEGLNIVDLPGFEGLSDTIHRQVQEELASVDGAIVVINDRAVGPALRVIERLEQTGAQLDAVVINLRSSKLLRDGTFDPLPDTHVAGNITELKAFVADALEGLDRKRLDRASPKPQLFAIHLPTMLARSVSNEPGRHASAHGVEIDRFVTWFDMRYGRGCVAIRLQRGLDLACTIAAKLGQGIETDIAMTKAIARGDRDTRAKAQARIMVRVSELSTVWQSALNDAGIDAAERRALDGVKVGIGQLKLHLKDLADRVTKSIPAKWTEQTANLARQIAGTLNDEIARARSELDDCVEKTLREYGSTCFQAALSVARKETDLLPIGLGEVKLAAVTSSDVWDCPYFDPKPVGFWEHIDAANVIHRLYRRIETDLVIDASRSGDMHNRFRECLRAHCDAQLAILQERLETLMRSAMGETELVKRTATDLDRQNSNLRRVHRVGDAARKALDRIVNVNRPYPDAVFGN